MQKLIKIVKLARALFPSRLPVGAAEFEAWVDSFYELYPMPTVDKDSIRYVLATTIIHLGPQASYKPKFFFYLTIQMAAAKQVASSAFQDIKFRQKQAEEAAKKAAEEQNADTSQSISTA